MEKIVMSLNHYVKMHTGGTTYPTAPMNVYLYPYANNSYLKSAVQSDGVVTNAIKNVADQLLNYGAIDYYAIYRWDYAHSETEYPYWGDIDNCTMDGIWQNFKSFVKNEGDTDYCGTVSKNGTGDNNYNHVGVHQLIHSGYTGCDETAGDYAPAGAGAERHGETAFNEGRVAWSPVCSNTSLTEAAAAQETLHMFMHPTYDGTSDCDSDPRQHSLGTLNYYRDFDYDVCTPMLTYHWDDFDDPKHNEDPYCPCPVDRESAAESHTLDLTSCTKHAVWNTADKMA